MIKRIFSMKWLVLACVMVSFFAAGRVLAYSTTSPYKLVGGVGNRSYYIGDPGGTWATPIRDGVSAWNATSTKVWYNTEQSFNGATLDYFVGNFGNVNWCGYTFYIDSNGYYINYGGYPTQNWYRNEVKIQDPPISGCPAFSKKGTGAHEMGHAMGLKHSSVSGALMYSPTPTDTPQTDDVNGINSMY